MADRLEDLLEAERRGLLPPDLQNDLNEARNRGLIPNASDLEASPFDNLVEGNVDVLRSAISGVGQGVQDMTIRLPQALSGMTSLSLIHI